MTHSCEINAADRTPAAPALSLVIPTYNESGNLLALCASVQAALGDRAFELIIVDDRSPDGTAAKARQLARTRSWLRVVEREGARGLSASILEGLRAGKGRVLAVMDGDLQHDPRALPRLLDALGQAELAVGSR